MSCDGHIFYIEGKTGIIGTLTRPSIPLACRDIVRKMCIADNRHRLERRFIFPQIGITFPEKKYYVSENLNITRKRNAPD
jgi:hypothetical protein